MKDLNSSSEEKLVFHKEDFFVDEREDYTIRWIVPNTQKNEMEPILLTLPPKGKSHEMVSHLGEEFGYVLRGSIKIKNLTHNVEYSLKKGETFYLDGNDEHLIINDSEKIAKFLWICTPPIF